MPELPEVQTVVNTLNGRLLGRRIVRVVHLREDILTPAGCDFARLIEGRTVSEIHRRAKRIIITLDDGNSFYIHLGMTGRLTVEASDAPLLPHTHLVAALDDGREQLRFRDPRRFGGIFWMGERPCDDTVGPEPLTIRVAELSERLKRTKRAIKNALLDQRLIAGLGNIYVDESLFDAKIHPLTRADRLKPEQVMSLNRSIKKVLRRALHHRGSTLRDYADANGNPGAFQRLHKVYDREGEPCPQCAKPLTRIVLGGRSTCFCKSCQSKGGRGSRRAAVLARDSARQEPRPPTGHR